MTRSTPHETASPDRPRARSPLPKGPPGIPFLGNTLELKADGTGTGRIGDATLQVVEVKRARDRIEVRAKLSGSLGSEDPGATS